MHDEIFLRDLLLKTIPQDGIIDLGDQGSFYVNPSTIRAHIEDLDTEIIGDIYAEGMWKLHDEHDTETPAIYIAFYQWYDNGGWEQVDWDIYEK